MKLHKKIEPRVVYLEWIDSAATHGWGRPDAQNRAVQIRSVGILVRETKRDLTISTCLSATGNTTDPLSIPKCSIRKVRTIRG